jgi:hypothetical protein
MKRLLYSLAAALTVVAVAACGDTTRPVAPPEVGGPSGNLTRVQPSDADLLQYFVRADAGDVATAVNEVAAKLSQVVAPFQVGGQEEVFCVGILTGVFRKVTVPENQGCLLINSIVIEEVEARMHSRLLAFGNQVGGNIRGGRANVVQVIFGTVGQNIEIRDGGDPTPFITGFAFGVGVGKSIVMTEHGKHDGAVRRGNLFAGLNLVREHIEILQNDVQIAMDIFQNIVVGNITVNQNTGTGFKRVQANQAQKVACQQNAPPFIGGPNIAAQREGQCF